MYTVNMDMKLKTIIITLNNVNTYVVRQNRFLKEIHVKKKLHKYSVLTRARILKHMFLLCIWDRNLIFVYKFVLLHSDSI